MAYRYLVLAGALAIGCTSAPPAHPVAPARMSPPFAFTFTPTPTTCSDSGPGNDTVYDSRAVAEQPRVRRVGPALVPENLTSRKAPPGRVVVSLVVGVDGRVLPGSVAVTATTDSAWDGVAKNAYANSLWWPGCLNGKRVAVRTSAALTFQREGP